MVQWRVYFFGGIFCFCQQVNTWYMYMRGPNFPYTKYGGYKWGLTNLVNVHTPMWKRRLKQHGRIPIDPAILAASGHRFIAKQKKKIKNANARDWGDARGDQIPETFLFCLKVLSSKYKIRLANSHFPAEQ